MLIAEIDSPPIEDLGPIPTDTGAAISRLSLNLIQNPGYHEPGRLSRRVILGEEPETADDRNLQALAMQVGEKFLGVTPPHGSIATLAMIINRESYAWHTQDDKAATHWHQDFINTDRGFFYMPDTTTRLIIPTLKGPLYTTGLLRIADAVQVEAVSAPEKADRAAALKAGPAVLGADGVLMKSEAAPKGGAIQEAEPSRVYRIPNQTVHKASPVLPTGRTLFTLDAVNL